LLARDIPIIGSKSKEVYGYQSKPGKTGAFSVRNSYLPVTEA